VSPEPPEPAESFASSDPGDRILPAPRQARIGELTVSYLDFGELFPEGRRSARSAQPLLALHGTFGRGAAFAEVGRRLAADGRFRLIALDQRGHGYSDRADDYGADAFVADAAAFLRLLGESVGDGPLPVLGHSRGGITAYQLAARHPESVSSLIIEDVGPVMRRPEVEHPVLPVRGWPSSAPTRAELGAAIEAAGAPDSGYFLQSAVPVPDDGPYGDRDAGRYSGPYGAREGELGEGSARRWRLLFDWDDMMAVQHSGVGDWWADWLGSRCPALVLRGGASTMLPAELARRMAELRPHTRLVEFPRAGHWIHDDDPGGVVEAVSGFLSGLAR